MEEAFKDATAKKVVVIVSTRAPNGRALPHYGYMGGLHGHSAFFMPFESSPSGG